MVGDSMPKNEVRIGETEDWGERIVAERLKRLKLILPNSGRGERKRWVLFFW